jgi:hypothetical protein
MSEILMPALMFIILFFGVVVLLTAFFVTLASFFDWFHQDEWPHLNE